MIWVRGGMNGRHERPGGSFGGHEADDRRSRRGLRGGPRNVHPSPSAPPCPSASRKESIEAPAVRTRTRPVASSTQEPRLPVDRPCPIAGRHGNCNHIETNILLAGRRSQGPKTQGIAWIPGFRAIPTRCPIGPDVSRYPATAPSHAANAYRRTRGILKRSIRIRSIPIPAPLPRISQHVVQAPCIGQFPFHRLVRRLVVSAKPRNGVQHRVRLRTIC